MNAATGVFTAPVNGRYHFSFTALSNTISTNNNDVYLRVNGAFIAISIGPSTRYNLPLVATLQLTKGDAVDVYLDGGSIYDNGYHFTQFSGFLLEEDLVLWSNQRRPAAAISLIWTVERDIWLIDSLCCAVLLFVRRWRLITIISLHWSIIAFIHINSIVTSSLHLLLNSKMEKVRKWTASNETTLVVIAWTHCEILRK